MLRSEKIHKNFFEKSSVTTDIYRIQTYDSVMCGYFCTGFTDFILKGKNLTDFTNLFSSNNLKKKKKWW